MGRIGTYALAGGLGSVRAGDSDGHAGGDEEGGEDRQKMHFVLVLVCIEARGRWLLLVRCTDTGAWKKGCHGEPWNGQI